MHMRLEVKHLQVQQVPLRARHLDTSDRCHSGIVNAFGLISKSLRDLAGMFFILRMLHRCTKNFTLTITKLTKFGSFQKVVYDVLHRFAHLDDCLFCSVALEDFAVVAGVQ